MKLTTASCLSIPCDPRIIPLVFTSVIFQGSQTWMMWVMPGSATMQPSSMASISWTKWTLNSALRFSRDSYHYYGFPTDKILVDEDSYQQRFNRVGFNLGLAKRELSESGLDYSASIDYATLNDLFEKKENDFTIGGHLGTKISEYYSKVNISLNYFKKTDDAPQQYDKFLNLGRTSSGLSPRCLSKRISSAFCSGSTLLLKKILNRPCMHFPPSSLICQLPKMY
jgi:hypothetical protein